MNDNLNNNANKESNGNDLDFQQLWNSCVTNWRWFLRSIATFVMMAGVYLWFTPQKVNVKGKMQITDKSKQMGQMSAGLAMLNSLPMGLGNTLGGTLGASGGINSEKEILMSNALVREVVNKLDLHTEYRLCSWGRRNLLYQNQPVNVSIPSDYLQWLDDELPQYSHQIILYITKNEKGYTVETTLKENKEKTELPDQSFSVLPATIKTGDGIVTLTENTLLREKDRENYKNGYTIKVTICPPMAKAMDFTEHLAIEDTDNKALDIVYIVLEDENALRGIDFVNNLAEVYNQWTNDEKNEEAQKTDEFVSDRLAKIDGELGASDDAWEKSKKSFQITDPTVDAQEVIQKKSIYESKMVEIGTQLQIHDYLSDFISNPANLYEMIPVGMGNFEDGKGSTETGLSSSASFIAQHNSLVSQRKQLLLSMSEKAPDVQRLTESIQELQPTLQTAMKRERQNILMKRDAVEREFGKYMGKVSNTPQMERVLTEIGRQREIKQGVYLLMLQKREETAMTLANTMDKGKLIDATLLIRNSQHPKKSIVLLAAFIMGLIFPMPFIFFAYLRGAGRPLR